MKKHILICKPCVYFLFNQKKIIYIGYTVQPVEAAVYSHRHTKIFDFYSVRYTPFGVAESPTFQFFDIKDAMNSAAAFIIKYLPEDNKNLPENDSYFRFNNLIKKCKSEFNMNRKEVMQLIYKYKIQPVFPPDYYNIHDIQESSLGLYDEENV